MFAAMTGRRATLWAALWALGILVLTLMPADDVPRVTWADRICLDKFVHAFLFGGQAVLAGMALAAWRPSAPRPLLPAFVAVVLFGAAVEVLQELMRQGRHGDVADLAADALGALAGLLLLRRRRRPGA